MARSVAIISASSHLSHYLPFCPHSTLVLRVGLSSFGKGAGQVSRVQHAAFSARRTRVANRKSTGRPTEQFESWGLRFAAAHVVPFETLCEQQKETHVLCNGQKAGADCCRSGEHFSAWALTSHRCSCSPFSARAQTLDTSSVRESVSGGLNRMGYNLEFCQIQRQRQTQTQTQRLNAQTHSRKDAARRTLSRTTMRGAPTHMQAPGSVGPCSRGR